MEATRPIEGIGKNNKSFFKYSEEAKLFRSRKSLGSYLFLSTFVCTLLWCCNKYLKVYKKACIEMGTYINKV